MALGATRRQVLSMVMRRGLWFAGSGLAAGQVLALMLNRTLKGLLVGVSTTDPLTLGCHRGLAAVRSGARLLPPGATRDARGPVGGAGRYE